MEKSIEQKQFLADIFTTALEGGIGYWACASKYHWHKEDSSDNCENDLDGFFAIVSDVEGEEAFPKNSRIDKEVIIKGLNKIVNDDSILINSTLRTIIKEANRTNDASNVDAEGADAIVQIGLFNEIVFG